MVFVERAQISSGLIIRCYSGCQNSTFWYTKISNLSLYEGYCMKKQWMVLGAMVVSLSTAQASDFFWSTVKGAALAATTKELAAWCGWAAVKYRHNFTVIETFEDAVAPLGWLVLAKLLYDSMDYEAKKSTYARWLRRVALAAPVGMELHYQLINGDGVKVAERGARDLFGFDLRQKNWWKDFKKNF